MTSHTPTNKKSVFDRIERGGDTSSGTTNASHKSTHGFCNAFIKTGACPLGETCKYIHEQPNRDKQSEMNEDLRLTTKTITRVIDMSSVPIKSTVTVSNEQRPVVVITNSGQSHRTVVESGADHSDRRLSGSERIHSKSRHSDSKAKSSSSSNDLSKRKSQPYESRHSSKTKKRSLDSDSAVSSASDSERTHSSRKHRKKSDSHSSSLKSKKHESLSSPRNEQDTLNDQIVRQTQTHKKSPKRTIVITERKKSDNGRQNNKDSVKARVNLDIEFLGSKKSDREVKATETIHQQAENNKKSTEIKREKKSPTKSSSDQQRRHSSSTNTSSTSTNEKNTQIKTEENKHQSSSERYERSDRHSLQPTPLIVQLSPTLPEISEKEPTIQTVETEKTTPVEPPSPICVILDDDSSPAPSIEKKTTRPIPVTPVKKTSENEKTTSKQSKRSRDSDKSHDKDKNNEAMEIKRKRLNDGGSRKLASSSKNGNEKRPASSRSDVHRSATDSSRDESSTRKFKDKSESKISRSNESKDRNTTTASSKSRSHNNRRDTTRSTPEKTRSIHRRDKEKGLENVTDSEEHHDEPILPKPTVLENYLSMDWSTLSHDKRIPFNTQVTSRITRLDPSTNPMGISDRLLTDEQKEQLNGMECHALPLRHYMKQLQTKSTAQIVHSCNRRLGSCAKDMIDMRHRWFTKSSGPVQQYEFINKDHYLTFQQAINSLLDKTSTDVPSVQIETATADVLL